MFPPFIYGTAWKEERTETLTAMALKAGFTGIDTANQRRHYVEAAVGDAVTAAVDRGEVAREDLVLQTKFTYMRGQDHRLPYDPDGDPETQVTQSFESSLEHLKSSYVDSYVLHGPESGAGISEADWAVWRTMEGFQDAGRARQIGVSNISLEQLEILCEGARVPPACVQNRCFARTGWDRDVRAFCRDNGIVYQGFSLLTANRRELEAAAVREIVDRTGWTLPQVVFRFAMQVGMVPLTGTTSAEHMAEDLACLELELDGADVDTIERIAG